MFSKTQFQTLFAYHWHTNARMMERAAQLDEAALNEIRGDSQRSILGLLIHTLRANRAWRTRLEGDNAALSSLPEEFPDLESLRVGFEQEQAAWQALLDGWSAEQIESDVSMVDRRGETRTFARWRVLQHLILHGMQHHTELAHALTVKGQSPGDIDFIFYR